jgi:hypothetical protein
MMRIARQLIALRLFLADRQQPDARRLDAEAHTRIQRAHVRELLQMLRPAFDGRARIEQHRRALPRRHGRRQRRTIHARQHAERRVRRDHRGAGMARAEQRRRLSGRHPIGRDLDRRLRFPAQRLDRRLGHLDHVGRIDDAHVEIACIGMSRELRANQILTANQIDRQTELRGRHGAIDGMSRRMVAAHCVNGNSHSLVNEVPSAATSERRRGSLNYSSSTGRTWRAR